VTAYAQDRLGDPGQPDRWELIFQFSTPVTSNKALDIQALKDRVADQFGYGRWGLGSGEYQIQISQHRNRSRHRVLWFAVHPAEVQPCTEAHKLAQDSIRKAQTEKEARLDSYARAIGRA
jgi:hypothetical protein